MRQGGHRYNPGIARVRDGQKAPMLTGKHLGRRHRADAVKCRRGSVLGPQSGIRMGEVVVSWWSQLVLPMSASKYFDINAKQTILSCSPEVDS
jgi:hypothetical protein